MRSRAQAAQIMSNESTLALAPAMGAGIGKMLAEKLLAHPEFVQLMVDAAIDGLKAMTPQRWDKDKKTWTRDPDFRTRSGMFFGLLAQMEGEPIKRIVHQHLGSAVTREDLVGLLHESPELQAAIERTLSNAKFKTRNVKRAQPVEDLD